MAYASTLIHNFGTLAEIMQAVAIFTGVGLTLGGLFQLKKHAESRGMMGGQHSMAGPMMMIIAGAMLMILPAFMGAMMLAFFGSNYQGGTYQTGASGFSALVPAVLVFVRLIGVGSFIRGVFMLSKTGGQQSQPGTLGKAIIHMFAGVLCLHIMGTIELLESLLGLSNG